MYFLIFEFKFCICRLVLVFDVVFISCFICVFFCLFVILFMFLKWLFLVLMIFFKILFCYGFVKNGRGVLFFFLCVFEWLFMVDDLIFVDGSCGVSIMWLIILFRLYVLWWRGGWNEVEGFFFFRFKRVFLIKDVLWLGGCWNKFWICMFFFMFGFVVWSLFLMFFKILMDFVVVIGLMDLLLFLMLFIVFLFFGDVLCFVMLMLWLLSRGLLFLEFLEFMKGFFGMLLLWLIIFFNVNLFIFDFVFWVWLLFDNFIVFGIGFVLILLKIKGFIGLLYILWKWLFGVFLLFLLFVKLFLIGLLVGDVGLLLLVRFF